VVVGVTRSSTSFASVGDTPQERALGAALDGVAADSALGMLLYGQLTSAGQAALAFKHMTGTIHADVRRVMLDDSRQPRDAVEQRLRQAGDTNGTTWWVHVLGDWSHADGSGGLAGAKADSSGGMVGVDTDVGDGSRLGVAVGLGHTSYRMGEQDSAHLKDRHLALYGRSMLGHVDLGYGVASTWHDIGTHRAFVVGNAPQQLNSDSHARTDQFFVDAGYRFGDNARRYVEPYVALAHVRLHSDALHEHGDVTALDVASGSDHATFGTLGLRWSAGTGVVHWYGTLGWRHVFGFGRPSAQAQFAGSGSAFAVQGLPLARNAVQVELGAGFRVGKRAHVLFGYDGLVARSASDNGAKAQLTVDF
jgi:outer membrane autotransporter protein